VHTTLEKGDAHTTLEIKVNLVRPLTKETGLIRAEGRILHRGRTLGTAEGEIKDAGGKLYAHATTTCMIFPAILSACRWSRAWNAARAAAKPTARPAGCPARSRLRFRPVRGG
jgi:hypothetical protein